MAMDRDGRIGRLLKKSIRWQAIVICLLAVFVVAPFWSAQAQQKPPEGYLGPPQPIPVPGDPNARPGPLSPLQPTVLPNVRVNDKVSDAPNQSQSETTIAVDPTNPLRLIGGFNDCRGFSIPSRNGISGWGFSVDGGATWTGVETGLPKAAPADFGARGDPSIDVDSAGNFYYANLYQRAGVGQLLLSVHKGRFTDSTFTWNPPTFATSPPVDADKEHLGVDKRPGSQTVYVAYTNFGVFPRRIEVVRSTDGGQTWSAPVVLASGNVQGSVPRVGPDGELYVAWATWPGAPRTVRIRKSTTWPDFGPEVLAAAMTPAANPPFNSRNPQFPSMDIDRTSGPNRGRVYITFDDGGFGGGGAIGTILLTHSPDGSAGSWSTPIRLDDDPQPPSMTGTHRWFSWPAVDARGVVHVAWYDRRLRGADPALTDVFGTQFRVGVGASPNYRITNQSFSMNVPSACTPNFGDYNGSTVGSTRFHFLYGDGREGNPDAYVGGAVTSPILADPTSRETCRPDPATTTITVLGGTGAFQGDVTLRLKEVSPPTDTIEAMFDPNPVPMPPPDGSRSTMTILTSGATPPGTYRLTVEGTDGNFTAETEVTLVVRSQPPSAPTLTSPANGEDSVLETPTFRWFAAFQATKYRLQIFQGDECTGTPVRDFENIIGTQFTVPAAAALEFFQRYSWKVIATNACGDTVSTQCFNFRTRSCVTAFHDVITNGGFEQDLTAWVVDANVPPPLAVLEQKRSGNKSGRLGVIGETGTPTRRGDSEVHQTVNIPPTAIEPRLSFWFLGQSSDSVLNDQQEVFVVPLSPPGPPVLLMREANNARTFINRTFSLAPFIGRTIEIHFRVRNNGNNLPTGMFVDDVSVTFRSCGGPDFLLTIVAPTFNEVCAGSSINFTVGVVSLNGPNFTSPVTLSARNLPLGASVTFAANPIPPGATTTMTLQTGSNTPSGRSFFSVVGQAVTPPPTDPREILADTFVSRNPPQVSEQITPLDGELNVPRRPTLTWTEPFVKNSPDPVLPSGGQIGIEFAGNLLSTTTPSGDQISINTFGAARYRVQVATDSGFTQIVVDAQTTDTSFTVPVDLEIATQYFWRVSATNACGTSPFSQIRSFITGACFEGWSTRPPVPVTDGPAQPSVVAAAGRIYVIGGGIGPGPSDRIRQLWEFNPATGAWTRRADIPTPGPGSTFGSAAEFGRRIYVFGGVTPNPTMILNTLWIYDIDANNWRRGRDLPGASFGIGVAVIGNRIILATGAASFGNQTWAYDPASDNYTRLADAPAFLFRAHADAIGNEMHLFAGGFDGRNHFVYNAATNAWGAAPLMPIGVTDPGVVALGGKYYVIGGRVPVSPSGAILQIFDPVTNTWTRGPDLGLSWLDNTDAAAVGLTIHVAGGFTGSNGTNVHLAFKICGPDTAHLISYAVDGDGSAQDIPNERTNLFLSNDLSGTNASATVFFNEGPAAVSASRTFSLAPREVRPLTNIIRQLRGSDVVQNLKGSLNIFATEPIGALAAIVSNTTNDQSLVAGQPLSGIKDGFVSLIQWNQALRTQVALHNSSGRTAAVQLLGYPPQGGTKPIVFNSVILPPFGLLDFPNVVSAMGLPMEHFGQLNWHSTQPITVFARDITADDGFSGTQPVRSVTDGSNTLFVAYVEDTETYSSHLQASNTGTFTANVTVKVVDVTDPTGGTPGSVNSRDVQIGVNSAMPIANIIRWALRSDSEVPLNKRGFIEISSPQLINALAWISNNASLDPSTTDTAVATTKSFTPIIIKFEPLSPGPPISSRVAIANPGTTATNVDLMAFQSNGMQALSSPHRIRVAARGQFFTNDIVGFLGLPPIFVGSMTITSDSPVVVFNQERTENNTGAAVPVYPR